MVSAPNMNGWAKVNFIPGRCSEKVNLEEYRKFVIDTMIGGRAEGSLFMLLLQYVSKWTVTWKKNRH